jgi:hypothetical protein
MVSATAAYAAGTLNMEWNNCTGEGNGAINKTFACGVTTGTNSLVCSFVAPAGVNTFNGCEVLVDVITQTSPLPAWWAMYNPMSDGTTFCRSALSGNVVINAAYTVCQDVWAGIGVGGIAAYANPIVALPNVGSSTNRATIDFAAAIPGGNEQALTEGTEYFICNINISNTKSTGAGSCAGCSDPACLSFTRLNVTQTTVPPGQADFTIATAGVNSLVTWQGTGADCAAVPVKRATWGAIKSMYR